MIDLHHPSDETLVRYAAGALGAGPALVVEAHLDQCRLCRNAVRDFEAVGGALLEDLPPAAPIVDGLERVLAAIDRGEAIRVAPARPASRQRPALPPGVRLPKSLDHCDFGGWRWVAPGIHVSRARGAWARDDVLKLLRVAPGKRLLRHGHHGTEWTYLLTGSFSDGRARFVAGDLSEVDSDIDHQPVIDGDSECICLVAAEGRMRPHGLLGNLYQRIFDA